MEASGREASGWELSDPAPFEEEAPGWLELAPGLEEEPPPFPPPQAVRDRTMAAASTAAKIRLFIVSKLLFCWGNDKTHFGVLWGLT